MFAAILRQMREILAAANHLGDGRSRVASIVGRLSEANKRPQQDASGRRRLHLDRAALEAHQSEAHSSEGCQRSPTSAEQRSRVSGGQSDLRRVSASGGQRFLEVRCASETTSAAQENVLLSGTVDTQAKRSSKDSVD